MSQFAVGIDLGTSTSEICIYRNDESTPISDPLTKVPIVPSIVAVNRSGELLVGENARSWVDVPNQGIREIKRKMGTGELVRLLSKDYRPEEISALILRKLKDNVEESLGSSIREVVLSVPANFPDAARQATLNAGELAGLKIIRLINEPTAAALAFGIKNIDLEEQLVVFDFGGGTLDITVLEMVAGVLDVKSSFGDPHLGGKDFDEALINLILSKFMAHHPNVQISDKARLDLKQQAENTKKALSVQRSYEVRLPYFAETGGRPVDLEVEVTRQEFEQAISPLLEKARSCVRQALNSKQIRPSAIDRVLLVGGTTYIPAVRQLVAEMFGKEPKADINPDLAVGLGAAIQAALAQGLISDETGIILTDVAPFGLGIDVLNYVGGQLMPIYEPLIQPNTTIPYSVKKEYTLMHAEQKQVEVRLYQDHTGKAKLPSDTIDTGIFGEITDIPPAPDDNPYPIEIEFSYDVNGIAKLRASIPRIGRSVEITYGQSDNRMSDRDKAEAAYRLKELWKQSEKAKQYEGLITKAERLMESDISGETKQNLSKSLVDLKEALATDNVQTIDPAGDRLVDLIFDIEN